MLRSAVSTLLSSANHGLIWATAPPCSSPPGSHQCPPRPSCSPRIIQQLLQERNVRVCVPIWALRWNQLWPIGFNMKVSLNTSHSPQPEGAFQWQNVFVWHLVWSFLCETETEENTESELNTFVLQILNDGFKYFFLFKIRKSASQSFYHLCFQRFLAISIVSLSNLSFYSSVNTPFIPPFQPSSLFIPLPPFAPLPLLLSSFLLTFPLSLLPADAAHWLTFHY